MNISYKWIAPLLGLCFSSNLYAQNLFVKQKDGTQQKFEIAKLRSITFPPGEIVVAQNDNKNTTFKMEAVRYLNFKDIPTNVQEIAHANSFSAIVYPNPSEAQLTIKLGMQESEATLIELLSIDGKVVHKATIAAQNLTHTLNIGQLSPGIYLCKLINSQKHQTVKFIKK